MFWFLPCLAKNENSATVKIVNLLFNGMVVPVFSEDILAEYEDVLCRKKFGFDHELVITFLTELRNIGRLLKATKSGIVLIDDKDVPFYDVVLESNADKTFLVTGNIKHFPKEKFIVTPSRFIELLNLLPDL